jgi:hypothetical protein
LRLAERFDNRTHPGVGISETLRTSSRAGLSIKAPEAAAVVSGDDAGEDPPMVPVPVVEERVTIGSSPATQPPRKTASTKAKAIRNRTPREATGEAILEACCRPRGS